MHKFHDGLWQSKRPPNVAAQPIKTQKFIIAVLPGKLLFHNGIVATNDLLNNHLTECILPLKTLCTQMAFSY